VFGTNLSVDGVEGSDSLQMGQKTCAIEHRCTDVHNVNLANAAYFNHYPTYSKGFDEWQTVGEVVEAVNKTFVC
jgi:hypothetical protein